MYRLTHKSDGPCPQVAGLIGDFLRQRNGLMAGQDGELVQFLLLNVTDSGGGNKHVRQKRGCWTSYTAIRFLLAALIGHIRIHPVQ